MVVDGDALMTAMNARQLDEATLARKAGVSEQTIRNYLNSTAARPWAASPASIAKVCSPLGIEAEDIEIEVLAPTAPDTDRELVADMRFLADPENVRRIDGRWKAVSIDLEIPEFVTYQQTTEWEAELVVTQAGSDFEAKGEDMDGDGVYACGRLFEGGSWIRFNYWIENPRLRQYGVSMVEFKGDGNTIEGLFVGRDGPHDSNKGMVVSKITLTRMEENDVKNC